MQLPLQDFTALIRTQAAAVTAGCRQLIDLSVGSVLRAVLEANAAIGLWVQWLIVEVLATTRAATSQSVDLDSWMADFGLSRLAATSATGLATFSRITPGLRAVIPLGVLVRTGFTTDAQSFQVVQSSANAAWNGNGYQLAASDLAITVPILALTAGRSGNVQAAAIGVLSSAIAGVDAVTNSAPLTGGMDAESDVALRSRFSGFLDSRTRATAQAVGYAVQSLRQGLSYTIQERVDTAGNVRPGHFTVTVDDGSGVPPDALLMQAAGAIDLVRPLGSTFSVRAPLLVMVDVEMHLSSSDANAISAVQTAVQAYIASLPIGAPLALSRLSQLAHDAASSVQSVWGVTINGVATDLVPSSFGLVRASTVGVAA